MPCIYCKTIKSPNSSTHSLSTCVEPADEVIGPIVTCLTAHPCDIMQQLVELTKYSRGQLAMACKQFDTYISGTKNYLIGAIIRQFFRRQVLSSIVLTITEEDMNQFNDSYNTIYETLPGDLRTSLINTMECLYMRIFEQRRNGLDYQHLLDAYRQNRRNRRNQRQSQTSHLRKLTIQIDVDQSISEKKECDICCEDEHSTAKLGCSHEFCVDCVHKLCASRTKTFISCPMCRAEVSNIHVGTAEMRQLLGDHILRC